LDFSEHFQEFILTRGKIIVADDRIAVAQQAVNEVAADEAAAPVTKTFSMIGRGV